MINGNRNEYKRIEKQKETKIDKTNRDEQKLINTNNSRNSYTRIEAKQRNETNKHNRN